MQPVSSRRRAGSMRAAAHSSPARRSHQISAGRSGVLVLRHDYWNWDTPHPLLFGFLPVGLWWQGMVSVLACGMMWLMVRFAWPGELEEEVIRMKDEGGRMKGE